MVNLQQTKPIFLFMHMYPCLRQKLLIYSSLSLHRNSEYFFNEPNKPNQIHPFPNTKLL